MQILILVELHRRHRVKDEAISTEPNNSIGVMNQQTSVKSCRCHVVLEEMLYTTSTIGFFS